MAITTTKKDIITTQLADVSTVTTEQQAAITELPKAGFWQTIYTLYSVVCHSTQYLGAIIVSALQSCLALTHTARDNAFDVRISDINTRNLTKAEHTKRLELALKRIENITDEESLATL